jgi:hypothetical protein
MLFPMHMHYPSLLVFLALLFLWCRVWTDDENTFFFNPFVAGPMRMVDRVLAVLRAPLPFLPNRALAALALLGALALKAAVFPALGNPGALFPMRYHHAWAVDIFIFLMFTFQISGVHAILRWMSPRRHDRAAQVAELVARPLAWIRPAPLQLLAVIGGIFVLCALPFAIVFFLIGRDVGAMANELFSETAKQAEFTEAFQHIHVKLWLSLSLTNTLAILQLWSRCALLAIFASLLGLVMPRGNVAVCGRDFASLLLGRFSGLLPVGMVDVTPLVFFYALNWLHGWLLGFIPKLF